MDNATPPPSYADLLAAARSLGRADGCFAASFEPDDGADPCTPVCQGRDPDEFAAELWADQPGPPPSGLVVNAPLWYADGFTAGLADERRRLAARRRDASARSPAATADRSRREPGSAV
jgi:hypothetical protein